MYIHIFIYTLHMYIITHVYTYKYMCVYTHIYIYIYIYIYMHMYVFNLRAPRFSEECAERHVIEHSTHISTYIQIVYIRVHICTYILYLHIHTLGLPNTKQSNIPHTYGVATISGLLKSIGLFCKKAL